MFTNASRVLRRSKNLNSVISLTQKRFKVEKMSSADIIAMENKYGAHNYHPLDVVIERGEGVYVWDPEGKRYFDFLSAYSALNQGHCHPRLIKVVQEQVSKLTLSSRAFYNNVLGQWAKYITSYFGYERVLPMNSGAEAVETALKLARKWGYEKKQIPANEAIIIAATDNFHGRTLGIISMSTSDETLHNFGPYLPGVVTVEYNSIKALEQVLEKHGSRVAGLLIEPIQGEAGVVVPDDGYLKKCYELCKKHNVLYLADEIQTGIGRTGKLLAVEWEGFKPDVLILGKALSGGIMPVSAVLADDAVMNVFTPGTHGSTYGGNPLGCVVSMEALEIIKDEKLSENAQRLGEIFRKEMSTLVKPNGLITKVRGKGLLNALVVDADHEKMKGKTAYAICKKLKDKGLLAKQTHDYIIRFAPPLVINEQQLHDCMAIIKTVVSDFEKN